MGFGAVIATGENNLPLDPDLASSIAEVRVEQTLDEPTRFAVRFLDDIGDGRLCHANDGRLAIDTIVSVIVDTTEDTSVLAPERTCLVRGPVVEHRSEMVIGGPGSAFEIHGLDRRDLLDRICVQAAWTGRASDTARQILGQAFDHLEVEDTIRVYEERRETLNQRDTDLQFVSQIARRNNLHCWITYDCGRSAIGSGFRVTETVHFASSPKRPQGALGTLASVVELALSGAPTLRVHVPSDQLPNVTAFKVSIDGGRPSRYRIGSMTTGEVRPTATEATDPEAPDGRGTRRLADFGQATRELCMPGSGEPQDTQSRGEAALTEAGRFVHASASTTRHLLGGVLAPHDVIQVVGVGPQLARTAFRVRQVTHVINAAEHLMDLQLDSNSLGEG